MLQVVGSGPIKSCLRIPKLLDMPILFIYTVATFILRNTP